MTRKISQVPTSGDDGRDHRRGERREDHLADDPVDLRAVAGPVDAAPADAGDGGADQAAEQRVRRARRQTEQPGGQVPHDAAHQTGQDDQQQGRPVVRGERRVGRPVGVLDGDDGVGHRQGHRDGQERSDEVEDRGQGDGGLGLEGTGRDGGGHRVAGVVEAVGEVEAERDDHDEDQGEQLCRHASECGTKVTSREIPGAQFAQC